MAGSSRIENVVVLMLENRSFDHMLGYHAGVNGLKGNEYNLLDPTKPISAANPAFYVSNGEPFAIPVGEEPGHSFTDANWQVYSNEDGHGAGTFVVYRSRDKYHWRLSDHKGRVLAESAVGYARRAAAIAAFKHAQAVAARGRIE